MKYPTEELKQYIQHFGGNQRETVLRELLENDILKRALDTSEGKLLLSSVIDLIAEKTMEIVGACIAGEDACAKVKHASMQINVAHRLLMNWATILDKGKKHEEGIG